MANQQDIYESYAHNFGVRISQRNIPPYMYNGVINYLMHGIEPGGFLQAVICNKLVQSYHRADDNNKECMYDWADILYNVFPSDSWGNEEKFNEWIKDGGLIGRMEAERNEENAE